MSSPKEDLEAAVWAGDADELSELASCICCCAEHTFGNCPARQWGGCRGGDGPTPLEETYAWFHHYQQFHGMTEAKFFGWEATP